MGTTFKLIFYEENDSLASQAAKTVFNRVDTLNAIFSDYLPESEINRLCQKAGDGQFHKTSPELFEILKMADEYSKMSKGAFDATVGTLTRLWRRSRSLKEMPPPEKWEWAMQKVGYQKVAFMETGEGQFVKLEIPGMQLDLGGIAQGYAADECLKILKDKFQIRQALADAGGDIALGDPPPGAEGWQIEIPTKKGKPKTILFLKNCGITTSGATFRFTEIDGKKYSHIIDPRTGWPIEKQILTTVLARNATEADAWATGISVWGKKGWRKIRHTFPGLKVWITTE